MLQGYSVGSPNQFVRLRMLLVVLCKSMVEEETVDKVDSFQGSFVWLLIGLYLFFQVFENANSQFFSQSVDLVR